MEGRFFAVLWISFFFSGCGSGGSSTTSSTSGTNRDPVISQVTADRTLFTAGDSATLKVTASDADGDTLTYSYIPAGAAGVSGSGSSVTLTVKSDASAQTFSVAVVVSDGKCTSCPSTTKSFEITTAGAIPKLSELQSSIFNSSCAKSGCHNGVQSPLLTSGNSFNSLVGVSSAFSAGKKLVEPGEPDLSVLYLRVSGSSEGNQMPKGETPLSSSQQTQIKDWIRAGAQNN